MSQTQLARAANLSRQTIANALADRVSKRTIGLIDDILPGSPLRSRSSVWATATQINEWAGRRESQEELPRLIRRLVLVTTADVSSISFRASEGVQLGGTDGHVQSASGSAFVPAGASVWELSTNAAPTAKASKDYAKRSGSRTATYVSVSARRWPQKDAWAAQRRAERCWANVRAYDADDLETWLEEAPSVHLWFSRRIGVTPQDCVDLESWWAEWRGATDPPLSGEFLLSGRGAASSEITKKLAGATRVVSVRAESQGEAIAFFAATLGQAQGLDGDAMLARSVVVESESAWRHLVAATGPLILLPTFDLGDLVSSAMDGGHTVVLPSGSGDAEPDDAIDIGPIARGPVVDLLRPADSGPRDDAWEQAALARRSMTAFRRSRAIALSLRSPSWAEPAVARRLVGPLMIGSWNESHEGDRDAVAGVAGSGYDEVVGALLPFANTTDPLVRRRGSLWYLVSPQDAWRQLGAFVTRTDLKRFETLAFEVLGTVDPRLELGPEKRWMSGVLLPPPRQSPLLRRGITDTIGLLGSVGGADEPGLRNEILIGFADSLAHRVFARVREEPRLWTSLSAYLPDLAEGAPEIFLREIEHALEDPSKMLPNVFSDSEADTLFGTSSPHVDVLWALERLAWSARYLGRVVRILDRLDRIDPGGKMVNRPAATLRAIFLPWLPQTSATVEQRLAVLDSWAAQNSRGAWRTFISMLPEIHGVGHYGARPRWHDWCPDEGRRVTRGEYWQSVRFAAAKLVNLAGSDAARWRDLLEVLPQFPEPELVAVLERLRQLNPNEMTEDEKSAIWNGLRALVAHHRLFAEATWAMSPERVSAIDAVRNTFAPKDLAARFAWLFHYRPELPDAVSRIDDFAGYDAELTSRRKAAVAEILREAGQAGLDVVAGGAEDPQGLGVAVGQCGALGDENEFIAARLGHEHPPIHQLAWGYLNGRVSDVGESDGREWLLRKFDDQSLCWTPTQRAFLLLGVRPSPEIWTLAGTEADVSREYWTRLNPFVVADEDCEKAVLNYLLHNRNFTAIALLGSRAEKRSPSPSLILDVLEAAVFGESTDRPDGMFSFYIGKLLDATGQVTGADEMRVAQLELGLLPAIGRYERTPKTLTRVMLREPSLFVDAIKLVYKARNAPKDSDESADPDARARATRAYELLYSVRGIPGSSPDGTVDADALNGWVDAARADLATHDRLETGLQEIGRLIASTPKRGADGLWPCEAVRDLIERLESEDFERGLEMGLYNSRGATTRSITEGGGPERALAHQYRQSAQSIASKWSRTGGVLYSIADTYDYEAKHHDLDVAVREDLGN